MSEKLWQPQEAVANANLLDLDPYRSELQAHVREIIGSPAFKGSTRSQQFLRHVIETAMAGRADQLKERTLGVELFGRSPAYDTGEDAIVRVTASDVRKRLHLFYAESGSNSEFRIELPAGSYIPEFRRVSARAPSSSTAGAEPAAAETDDAPRGSRKKIAWLVLCAICVAALGFWAGWLWHQRSSAGAVSSVRNLLPWSALFQPGRQLQLVLSDPDISSLQELLGFDVSLSDYANRRYVPDSAVLTSETRQVLHSFRGVNVPYVDMGIALRVSEIAGNRSQALATHNARSLQLSNFKTEDNFILLGSPRSNPWGTLFEDQLDFRFKYDDKLRQEVIRNVRKQQGEQDFYIPTARGWDTGEAFAILALVSNPNQTGHVLLLAGTNAEGTEAAGKLATTPELLLGSCQRCGIDPKGPPRHFQVLLRVRTMAGSPAMLEVIACHQLANPTAP